MKKINLLPKTFQFLEKIGLPSCSRKCYHLAIIVHLTLQKGMQVSDLSSLCAAAAALCHTSPDVLEQSVREAVRDCWENSRDILEKLAGHRLSQVPEPVQFIQALALQITRL